MRWFARFAAGVAAVVVLGLIVQLLLYAFQWPTTDSGWFVAGWMFGAFISAPISACVNK